MTVEPKEDGGYEFNASCRIPNIYPSVDKGVAASRGVLAGYPLVDAGNT